MEFPTISKIVLYKIYSVFFLSKVTHLLKGDEIYAKYEFCYWLLLINIKGNIIVVIMATLK